MGQGIQEIKSKGQTKMNKLPKEIYVEEDSEGHAYYVNPEECAMTGKTVTLGVYKLVGKVEVSTQIKQEIVVKKSPKKTKTESIPVGRNPLLQEMRVVEVAE
jgi:hypothetical protein